MLAFDKNGIRLGYGKGFMIDFLKKKNLFYLGYGYEDRSKLFTF